MDYRTLLTVVVLVQPLAIPRSASATCPMTPDQSTRQILNCMANFMRVIYLNISSITDDAIRNYCATAADQEARCLDRLLYDCNLTSEMPPNSYRGFISVLCKPDNTAEIVAKKACINSQRPIVDSCTASRGRKHQIRSFNIHQQLNTKGQQWLQEELQKVDCVFYDDLKICGRPYRQHCGNKTGDIYDALHSPLVPAACVRETTRRSTPSPTIEASPTRSVPKATPNSFTPNVTQASLPNHGTWKCTPGLITAVFLGLGVIVRS